MPRITPDRDGNGNIISEWEDGGVEQIETSDSVLGGDPERNGLRHSPPNYSFKEIVNRVGYLYKRIEQVASSIPGTIRAATLTVQGIARLASLAKVLEGLEDNTIVTPKTLQGKIDAIPTPDPPPKSTTNLLGLIELINQTEARLGTDDERAVTIAKLLDALRVGSPFQANTTRRGVVERLTQAEARLGTDLERYLTAALLLDALRNGTVFKATQTERGVVEFATNAETKSNSPRSDLAVSPANVRDFFFTADW